MPEGNSGIFRGREGKKRINCQSKISRQCIESGLLNISIKRPTKKMTFDYTINFHLPFFFIFSRSIPNLSTTIIYIAKPIPRPPPQKKPKTKQNRDTSVPL